MARSDWLRRNGIYPKHSGRGPALRDPFHQLSGQPREPAKPCVHKASPRGGGVGEADGGGSIRKIARSTIDDPKTPSADRCAIAPQGGGLNDELEQQPVEPA